MKWFPNLHKALVFAILPGLCFLFSCSDVNKEYYPDGMVKSEVRYKGGQMDGPAIWYWENGNKQLECTYSNGQLEGKVTRWFHGGSRQREDNYLNNQRNGTSLVWDESGYQSALETYRNDTLDGAYKEWHPNGELLVEGTFSMGYWNGIWSYYDDKGILVGKGDFKKGNGKLTGYFWNGKIKREISYQKNLKHGPEIWYNQDGVKEKEILFDNGRITDIITGDTTSISSRI